MLYVYESIKVKQIILSFVCLVIITSSMSIIFETHCPTASLGDFLSFFLYPRTTKLLLLLLLFCGWVLGGGVYIAFTLSGRQAVCPAVIPALRVRCVIPTLLDRFFPYLAQMIIIIIIGCVAYNDLWPKCSRSFSHDFAINLLKYGTSCCVRPTTHTILDGFSPYLVQIISSMRGCRA